MARKMKTDNLQADIERLVATFVEQVTELARRAALDDLKSSIRVTHTSLAKSSGAKRPKDELEGLGMRFLNYVDKHPGERIEQINKGLGTTTKALRLPVKKLIEDGQVKTKGQKRSMTHFAA